MSTSYWLNRSSPSAPQACDVVIVGGGIAGLSAAYWLQQEDPHLKVTVIEKRRLGAGATGRNAGFITCGSVEHFNRLVGQHGLSKAQEIWNFSEDNLRMLNEALPLNLINHGFAQQGSFSLATSQTEWEELQATAALMRQAKIPMELIAGGPLQQRLGVQGFCGGIKYLNDASVHPVRLLEALRDQTHCEVLEGCEYFDYQRVSSRLQILTDQVTLEADHLILAGNGYLPTLHPYFQNKVFPTRGQILITEPVPAFMEGPCYANFFLDYFRQLPGGEVLIGGFRQLEKATEVGYSDHITEVIQNALAQFLDDHLPSLKGKRILQRWAGIMGFSVDGQPMIGSLPSDPQVFFVGGFTGHGLGLAFHSGKVLVDLMFGRPIPDFISARRLGS